MHFSPRTRPLKLPFLKSLRLDSFLSFAPGSEAIVLQGLNVLIGPNGSGKSNVIEAVELLKSLPVDFAAAVRMGGGAEGFLWKGASQPTVSTIEIRLQDFDPFSENASFEIAFESIKQRLRISDEILKFHSSDGAIEGDYSLSRAVILSQRRSLKPDSFSDILKVGDDSRPNNSSILSLRDNAFRNNELFFLGDALGSIQTFREWTFGRSSALRR